MALRGPRPALLLPLALLVACLALAGGQKWNPLNDIFRRKHVDFPKTIATNNNAYCKRMMWDRVIYGKHTNTFIHASNRDINKICTTDGVTSGPYRYVSKKSFNITICMLEPWSISYNGVNATQKIVIGCWKELPFFYVRHI